MKSIKSKIPTTPFALTFTFILIILLSQPLTFPQDLNIHSVIGKKQSEVIKKFGSPVHRDNSNPDMVCMFYKANNLNMVFVSDREGVYQAEATAVFDTEESARRKVDGVISFSLQNEFTADTVTASDFHLHKSGVKADLQLSENKISKKYEVRIKANRTEE